MAPSVNVPAQLKPLTLITGTNLFLNIPYKWHDHTKPGCYVTRITGNPDRYVTKVCNKDDQQWYKTPNASWVFERTQGADSTDEYNGNIRIKNIGSGHYITLDFDTDNLVLKERPHDSESRSALIRRTMGNDFSLYVASQINVPNSQSIP